MILKSMEDVLDRFSNAGLYLFDTATRYDYDDDTIARKDKDRFMVYFVEMLLNMAEEARKSSEDMHR